MLKPSSNQSIYAKQPTIQMKKKDQFHQTRVQQNCTNSPCTTNSKHRYHVSGLKQPVLPLYAIADVYCTECTSSWVYTTHSFGYVFRAYVKKNGCRAVCGGEFMWKMLWSVSGRANERTERDSAACVCGCCVSVWWCSELCLAGQQLRFAACSASSWMGETYFVLPIELDVNGLSRSEDVATRCRLFK